MHNYAMTMDTDREFREGQGQPNIACDIDGTLLNYGKKKNDSDIANALLIEHLAKETTSVTLVTNQGPLALSLVSATEFTERIEALHHWLHRKDITIVALYISLWHEKADPAKLPAIKEELVLELFHMPFEVFVYTDSEWRKPSPRMLLAAEADVFYGDSVEDMEAAAAAGCKWVKVACFDGKNPFTYQPFLS